MNLTTITFPAEDEQALREAVRFYGYATVTQFFRTAGHTLIRHHKANDRLLSPLAFNSAPPLTPPINPLNLIQQERINQEA